jgi:hypothetical protein
VPSFTCGELKWSKKLATESIEYNKKYYSEIYTYFISMNASLNSEATGVKNETEDEGELILLFLIENFN